MNTRSANKGLLGALIIIALLLGGLLIYGGYYLLGPGRAAVGNGGIFPGAGPSVDGNRLQLPVLLEDLNPDPMTAEYILQAKEGEMAFFEGKTTKTFGYNGNYLGPLIRMRDGETVSIRVDNMLSAVTTVHWHGLEVDGGQDGGPHQGIPAGDSWKPTFTVDQPAATLWYHPHLKGTTADQVYMGLAGLIYIEDEVSDSLNLPKDYGVNDFPVIVQDRNFAPDGSFDHQTNMMGVVPGDTLLVNGTIEPFVEVNRGKVRLRLVDASNSENYSFTMSDGSAFQQVASDGGFLEAPVTRSRVFLAPGERAEVIVDFSETEEDTVSLMIGKFRVVEFRLSDKGQDTTEVPEKLASLPEVDESVATEERYFEMEGMGISGTINGKYFNMNRIDEEVTLGDTEIWTVTTVGGMMMQQGGHPFHIHGTQFRILTRDGREPPPEERGFKDTVFVDTGEEVRLLVRFDHEGMFMYHCHILEHEDFGMMGQFMVRPE
jgi:FtsP/CotA-like multicopper oxidase with cupredoxin domain